MSCGRKCLVASSTHFNQSSTTNFHHSNIDLELLRIWLYISASFLPCELHWNDQLVNQFTPGEASSVLASLAENSVSKFFLWYALSKKGKLGIPQLLFIEQVTMAYFVVKRWNAEIFDVSSIHFAPWIRLFLTMFIMLHYDLAILKKRSVACIQMNSVSLSCEASYWNIWSYVLQIYGLARDLCNKGCKIITCLKLSLFGMLFGDFCVYFLKGVNVQHIFLNKSSCSANVSL